MILTIGVLLLVTGATALLRTVQRRTVQRRTNASIPPQSVDDLPIE